MSAKLLGASEANFLSSQKHHFWNGNYLVSKAAKYQKIISFPVNSNKELPSQNGNQIVPQVPQI
jgi:hypothetical protein